ncbi:unnamed protein product, partial [Mesorhabditis spiculigera]
MWQSFFTSAGIPPNIAARYAKSFADNRIDEGMLGDLDKATLVELGVQAVGDQLAILRRIKDGPPPPAVATKSAPVTPKSTVKVRVPITGPMSGSRSSTSGTTILPASEARKGRPPPDSHEIYHVRMPTGATRKTQQILQKAQELRTAGILKRAHSGVRQGGRPVDPISRDPAAKRLAMHNKFMQIQEVSSSTDLSERLGVRGMYSDKTTVSGSSGVIHRVQTGKIVKRISAPPDLFSRALASASTNLDEAEEDDGEPVIRVRLNAKPTAASQMAKPQSIATARVTVSNSGAGRSLVRTIQQQQQQQPQQTTRIRIGGPAAGGAIKNVQQNKSIYERMKIKGGSAAGASRQQPNVKMVYRRSVGDTVQYEDDDEEAMDDTEELYDDDEGEDEPGRSSIFSRIRL